MSTQVVLGFVGQLATASLIPAAGMPQWLGRDRLDRTRLEQELPGLNGIEIGGLLMRSWELPAALVDDVTDMGRLLVTPPAAIEPERLRGCLAHPMLARLPAALQSPELQAAVRQMLGEPAEA